MWLEEVSLARWGDGGGWGHRRAAGGEPCGEGAVLCPDSGGGYMSLHMW